MSVFLRIFLTGVLVLGLGEGISSAGEWSPMSREIERYSLIWERSPFVAVSNVLATGTIAARYKVTGFARVGTEEVVFVFDRTELKRFPVTKGRPENGVELLELLQTEDIKELQAKIRVGGEVALISYEGEVQEVSSSGALAAVEASEKPQATGSPPAEEKGPVVKKVIPRPLIKSQP